jgi:pimeloyl-ACP methyl ester carboxylesterase
VILALRHEGLNVTSAPLPLTSLKDDAAALQRVIERVAGPIILVGHAYAGAVIATTRDERVRTLVYVAALAPDEGETVADVFYRAAPHPEAPKLAPDRYGTIWMPEESFGKAVAHKASVDQLAIMSAVQRPISLTCIQEKVTAPAWKDKPAWFFIAEEDRMIAPESQHFMADRMGATVRSHHVDHAPMYTAPNLVVDIVLEAAQRINGK